MPHIVVASVVVRSSVVAQVSVVEERELVVVVVLAALFAVRNSRRNQQLVLVQLADRTAVFSWLDVRTPLPHCLQAHGLASSDLKKVTLR